VPARGQVQGDLPAAVPGDPGGNIDQVAAQRGAAGLGIGEAGLRRGPAADCNGGSAFGYQAAGLTFPGATLPSRIAATCRSDAGESTGSCARLILSVVCDTIDG
jgi:hypothetical protein